MARYGVGCISEVDGLQHAVVHRPLLHDSALCRAGRITLTMLGDFDPADVHACPVCALTVVEGEGELAPAITRLVSEFPDAPADAIVSMLADSYRTVVTVSGRPLVDKAEQLTRLRLEVRTGHPARPPATPATPV